MKQISFLFLMFCIGFTGIAQQLYYETYNWDKPVIFSTDTVSPKVILCENSTIEYTFIDDNFTQFNLVHSIEQINSEEEIEANNKRFININSNNELVVAKARVINRNQKTFELDQSQILSSTDEKTGKTHHYFALDGIEKGCIINLYYVIRKTPSYNGNIQYIQDQYPTDSFEFNLITPSHLVFEFATYNDTNTIKNIESENKNHYQLKLTNIPALIDEDQSPYYQSLKQVWYKLDKNLANSTKDISSYGDASQNVYQNLFVLTDSKDVKALAKLKKQIPVTNSESAEQLIIDIENYLKANINIIEAYGPPYNQTSWIIDNKTASTNGMTMLFVQLFKAFNLNFQVVLTNDRTVSFFNKDFESYNCLDSYLIFFPDLKKYLDPENFIYRFPLIPYELTDNNGLFIKETTLGDFSTGIGKVKYIDPLGYRDSYNDMNISASFAPDFDSTLLNIEIISMGYYALYNQAYYALLNQQDKKDMIRENLDMYMKDLAYDDYTVINGEVELVGKKPYIVQTKAKTVNLIETAGNKFLFKAGELIGPQVEMYSEKERQLPVHDSYKRSFIRHLKIEIPDGFTIKNLNDLNIDEHYIIGNDTILIFNSKYTTDGHVVNIEITEYYDQLYYKVSEYEAYRKVVNAAADFNKIILVFEPTQN